MIYKQGVKAKQLNLIPKKRYRPGTKAHAINTAQVFGGALAYRKVSRPFEKRKSAHIVLRSRLLVGARSLLKANRSKWIESLLQKKAAKYDARLYKFSINSNHLHLLMKFNCQQDQANFLRDTAGTLALKIKKTFKIPKNIKVWDDRPFSRLVAWGKAFQFAVKYIEKNINESTGLWPYQTRKAHFLDQLLRKIELRSLS